MKFFKLLCGIVLCVGLCCVIAGGGIFYARRSAAGDDQKIKAHMTFRLSTFTEIEHRDSLTLCAARGLSAQLPENTLEAIRAAGEAGYRYVLLDVAMTRDTVPVLLADDTLVRMTTGSAPVRALPFDALRNYPLDNGAGIEKQTSPVCIPPLADALDVCRAYDMTPLLCVRTLRGIRELQSMLRQCGRDYLIVSSQKSVLDAFRDERCARLYHAGALTDRNIQYARRHNCGLLFDAAQTAPENIRAAHDLPLWAQTVRSRIVLKALAENGVKNVVTDCILPMQSQAK